jgi:hypothetical protein
VEPERKNRHFVRRIFNIEAGEQGFFKGGAAKVDVDTCHVGKLFGGTVISGYGDRNSAFQTPSLFFGRKPERCLYPGDKRVDKGLDKGRRSMGFQGIFYANYLRLTVLSWKTQEPCLT